MCLYKCVDYLTACDGCDILGPMPLFKMTSKMAAKIWKSMLIQKWHNFTTITPTLMMRIIISEICVFLL